MNKIPARTWGHQGERTLGGYGTRSKEQISISIEAELGTTHTHTHTQALTLAHMLLANEIEILNEQDIVHARVITKMKG